MRIGLNSNNLPASEATKTGNSAPSSNSSSASQVQGKQEDTVTLSGLATQAMRSPELRADRVKALQNSVSSGQYRLDSRASASAMLGEQG